MVVMCCYVFSSISNDTNLEYLFTLSYPDSHIQQTKPIMHGGRHFVLLKIESDLSNIIILFHCGKNDEPYSFAGDRRAVQAGRSVGERQEGDHVLAGLSNHLHLPHDLQLLPLGHSGRDIQVCLLWLPSSHENVMLSTVKNTNSLSDFQVCLSMHLSPVVGTSAAASHYQNAPLSSSLCSAKAMYDRTSLSGQKYPLTAKFHYRLKEKKTCFGRSLLKGLALSLTDVIGWHGMPRRIPFDSAVIEE